MTVSAAACPTPAYTDSDACDDDVDGSVSCLLSLGTSVVSRDSSAAATFAGISRSSSSSSSAARRVPSRETAAKA